MRVLTVFGNSWADGERPRIGSAVYRSAGLVAASTRLGFLRGTTKPATSLTGRGFTWTWHEPSPFVLAVTGGRDIFDMPMVWGALDRLGLDRARLVHGAATGVDTICEYWALHNGKEVVSVPYGRSRNGPERNQLMLSSHDPHMVVAFGGGRGTADMINRAIVQGVPVLLEKGPTTDD